MKLKKDRDILGSEVKPGHYIIYGAAKGRCAGLNIGKVVEVYNKTGGYGGQALWVKANSVQEYFGEYRVPGLEQWNGERYAKGKPRTVTLQYTERMCVIPEAIVPDFIKEMLRYL